VAHSDKATVDEQGDSNLWLGKIYDSGGQRQKALDQYNAALKLDCNQEIRDEASKYKRSPFK
jgi:hypothetical protein